ncbi:MAG: hypothetical protein GVY02_08405 [Bacteroidetes bacterium]|nr:hypothetical protein [Bacteroidota bacterium]
MNECRRVLVAILLLYSATFFITDDSFVQLRYHHTPAIKLVPFSLQQGTCLRHQEQQVTSPDSLVADLTEVLQPYGLQVTPD